MGLLRNLVAKGLSGRILIGPRKRVVFLYHDISDPDSPPQYSALYSTQVRNFKAQVDLIARYFKLGTLPEVVASGANNKQRMASITFNDGFLSVKEVGLPYLQAPGIPFTIFINSMAVKNNQCRQVKETSIKVGRRSKSKAKCLVRVSTKVFQEAVKSLIDTIFSELVVLHN